MAQYRTRTTIVSAEEVPPGGLMSDATGRVVQTEFGDMLVNGILVRADDFRALYEPIEDAPEETPEPEEMPVAAAPRRRGRPPKAAVSDEPDPEPEADHEADHEDDEK